VHPGVISRKSADYCAAENPPEKIRLVANPPKFVVSRPQQSKTFGWEVYYQRYMYLHIIVLNCYYFMYLEVLKNSDYVVSTG